MHDLFDKEELSLVVTDSGLGGLAICAEMVRNLVSQRLFRNLSVVYFNAWPLKDKGYNLLEDDAERIRVFSNAVDAMQQFAPDCIYIACNTLSILYQQGGMAGKIAVPVVDIINFGVDMVAARLNAYPRSGVVIMGTETTISTSMHKALLVNQGIAGDRIWQQNCHGLAGAIELAPGSSQVKALADQFMAEAAAKVPQGIDHLFAALCCTHYAYIEDLISQSLSRSTGARVDIINPNQGMSDSVTGSQTDKRFGDVNLKTKVVSRVPLTSQNIDFISARLKGVAPEMTKALKNYALIPKLFEV